MNYCRLEYLLANRKDENCGTTQYSIKARGKVTTVHHLCSDIWQRISEYFEVKELFNIFAHITSEADQILFGTSNHYQLRGLIMDNNVTDLPPTLNLICIVSLTLYDTCCFEIIQQCMEIRSLKLIGEAKWITSIIRQISQTFYKLEQLAIMISGIGSLLEVLIFVVSITSLRRLEICADHFMEHQNDFSPVMASSNLEQFIINSCNMIDWNDFSYVLPCFVDLHLLSVSLLDDQQKSIPSFNFQNLRSLNIGLREISFNWIVQLVATMPNLAKLKLNGLVNEDGFVINQRWAYLLKSTSSITHIFVNVFLQQDTCSYFSEAIKEKLSAFCLNLTSSDDDMDCSIADENVNRWWNLKGTIIKQGLTV
ncbi:unnamed protein product [Adineta ricciae]|uniref:Uncharacterized protein n=1 Tax=Adineta ricciae TaxID=249248 RepID=A0A815TR90_ADIRI|nr:unnamed protein product [Adineta ricciae]CAF1507436.1 unnamed protein product [Adineta ricciae]